VKPKKFSVRIDKERCKGCGMCVPFCARGLLRMSDRLNNSGHPFIDIQGGENCGGCMNCAVMCPEAAVEIAHADSTAVTAQTVAAPSEVPEPAEQAWATGWAESPSARRSTRAKRGALARKEA
jgi:2-oxoglutarate ferredoxin oxidoreductase subunit delta